MSVRKWTRWSANICARQLFLSLSKYIKIGEPVPPEIRAKAPLKDFGDRLAVCQAVTIVRKLGSVIQLTTRDQSCPLAQVIVGYVEEPDFIRDGSVVFPLYTFNMETAKKTQETTPRMPKADTGTILVAPLHRTAFEPDVVVIYGNAAQVVRMVQGALYNEGGYIESRFAGRGAFQSFIEGVVATHKGGVARMPTPIAGINVEPKWPSTYDKLRDYVDSL